MKRIHSNTAEGTGVANSTYRDRIDLLRSRIGMLVGRDRLLLTMHIENGNSFRQMARLAGMNEASIGRKIHKIMKRLTEGEYIRCLRNRERFSSKEMAIAKDYFMVGMSIEKIATKQKLTYYAVRKNIRRIRKAVAGMQR